MDSPLPSCRRRTIRSARVALLWALFALVASQLGLIALADAFAPEVYDPEYAARLARLRDRRAEHPDRPLLAMLGSSRTCHLFRPEALPPLTTPGGKRVLAFNFSRAGGGPVYSRFAYRRLRQENLTPDWLVVEFAPMFFIKDAERYFYPGVTASELPALSGYISSRRALGFYAKYRCLPWRSNRAGLVREFAPRWSTPFGLADPERIDSLGGEGERMIVSLSDTERSAAIASAAAAYKQMMDDYRIDPGIDRAFRDLLRECRSAGTKVVVLRTPESTAFREAYSAEARAAVREYQAGLTREFGVPIIDALAWLPDDQFSDGHHPLMAGQVTFTARLHREVLVSLVAGGFSSD